MKSPNCHLEPDRELSKPNQIHLIMNSRIKSPNCPNLEPDHEQNMSKNVQKSPKASKNFQKCPNMPKNVQKHLKLPEMSKSVQKHPKMFKNGQTCQKSQNLSNYFKT